MPYLKHRHTQTCNKGKRNQNKNKCRFNFPIPAILIPLEDDSASEDLKTVFKRIKILMYSYFMKPQDNEEILFNLEVTEETYIMAVRSSLTRPQVFLKRGSLEVGINSYNTEILNLFEANIDMQYVLEEYGLASYIVNYISKFDSGMTSLLGQAASEKSSNNKDKLKDISNVFINSNLCHHHKKRHIMCWFYL